MTHSRSKLPKAAPQASASALRAAHEATPPGSVVAAAKAAREATPVGSVVAAVKAARESAPPGSLAAAAKAAREAGLAPGSRFLLGIDPDGSIRLRPYRAVADRNRGLLAELDGSMADELVNERRRDAAAEDAGD